MALDPVTVFCEEKDELELVFDEFEKFAASKKDRDLELWKKWNEGGRKQEDLDELLEQLKPVINKAAYVYAGKVNIPKPAVEGQFRIQALKAIGTYDPNKAALHTHVTHQMKAARRFINKYQNTARIPGDKINRVGDVQRAEATLFDELGREPSDQEIADNLSMPKTTVSLLRQQNRRDIPFSKIEGGGQFDYQVDEASEVLSFLPTDLSREENLVFEQLTGAGGRRKLTANQVAQRLGMSPAKVSRIRASIAKKAKRFYTG